MPMTVSVCEAGEFEPMQDNHRDVGKLTTEPSVKPSVASESLAKPDSGTILC